MKISKLQPAKFLLGDPAVRLQSLVATLRHDVERYGLAPAVSRTAIWSLNHITLFKILRCVHLAAADPTYLQTDAHYRCGFLDPAALAPYSHREEYELPEAFLERAFTKGDQCFGILDGDVLAAYGWYSNSETDVAEDLTLHFDRRYIYMYKGFTHPQYRGRRLHGIGMSMAFVEYLNRGFHGLVSVVESTNFDSLKSVQRIGYRQFGSICVVKAFGRYLPYSTPGCANYAFRVTTRRNTTPMSSQPLN